MSETGGFRGAGALSVVCTNGHVAESVRHEALAESEWCGTCGAALLSACPGCREPIPALGFAGGATSPPPQYCAACGRPFPWTERAVSAARSMIRELAMLDQYERDQLRRSVDHLMRETPQTPLAITRIRTLLERIGGTHAQALRELLLSVASDPVKQRLRERL